MSSHEDISLILYIMNYSNPVSLAAYLMHFWRLCLKLSSVTCSVMTKRSHLTFPTKWSTTLPLSSYLCTELRVTFGSRHLNIKVLLKIFTFHRQNYDHVYDIPVQWKHAAPMNEWLHLIHHTNFVIQVPVTSRQYNSQKTEWSIILEHYLKLTCFSDIY